MIYITLFIKNGPLKSYHKDIKNHMTLKYTILLHSLWYFVSQV
jgi:hypothetical protein